HHYYTECVVNISRTSVPVDFRLVVPEHTIYADQGADVNLQVHFSPITSAESLTVNWLKEKVFIYEYVHGKEIRHRHYEDRVGLIIQELSRGNIILTLKNVQLSDSGSYTCQVKYEEYTGEKKIELHVGGKRKLFFHYLKAVFHYLISVDHHC
uniref:Ig-like domain-containing protein n=1 Tax=Sinocyclocheilus rhinocerous TaxID=307959 RepID=A0A673G8R9_9TELE